MIVMKFGGTSVGAPDRMKSVAALVNTSTPKVVVLSALSGTTNSLTSISDLLYAKKHDDASNIIKNLELHYNKFISELFTTDEYKNKALQTMHTNFDTIKNCVTNSFSSVEERIILAQGELMSTALFHLHLAETGVKSNLLPALNFMRTDKSGEPDPYFIKELLRHEMEKCTESLIITQGYICRNAKGEIDNLKRGGSDYSASLIGEMLEVEEIQIWTDIDGMHNNDPRMVENTKPVRHLSFDEAAELAYFGAKILHPASIIPAQEANINVRLKNTLEPNAEGTLISTPNTDGVIKAIAAKDNITAIKIKSGRMLLAYGFLHKVFGVFDEYCTSIDMITTSEIAVSLTIDNTSHIDAIIKDLHDFGKVEVENNMTIISVVGYNISNNEGTAKKVFDALENVPIRMISYGGSRHNISMLIDSSFKKQALEQLSSYLF